MKLKKDLAIVAAVALLGAVAFIISRRAAPEPPRHRDPYRPEAGVPVLVRYRAAGGLSTLAEIEIAVRGAGDALVRYRAHGGPAVERPHPVAEGEFRDLLARLARTDFFEVDEVPRSGYIADLPTTTLAFTVGDRTHDVTVDPRRRSSRDLDLVYRWFRDLQREVTPEPVASGD